MKKVVIKIGSSVIAPSGKLDAGLIENIVKDIITLEAKGYKVVIVTSGAISCALEKMGYKRKPNDMHSLMALSSIGQIKLMRVFSEKFKKYKRFCSQILLTWDDFDNRKRFFNVKETIEKLFVMKVIPVINENDAVSYNEIRFGDNDRLSALVADLICADRLIILSDVEGLLADGKVLHEVREMSAQTFALVKQKKETHTSGGMLTKLQAVGIAVSSGITAYIAYGRTKNIISKIMKDEAIGTKFYPLQKACRARKRWIAFGKKPKGSICVDEGAKTAILEKGKSLLSAGIIKVSGKFSKNDAVHIIGKDGALIGYGIVNYDSGDIVIKSKLRNEVIHRDNFTSAIHDWCINITCGRDKNE
ncbi:MAG: glutamate 5-kinase [Candidatus Omnitrophota bacterium]